MAKLEMRGASDAFINYLEKEVYPHLEEGESECFELLDVRDANGKPKKMTRTSVALLSQFQIYDFKAKKSVDCYWVTGENITDVNSNGVSTKQTRKFKFTRAKSGREWCRWNKPETFEMRKLFYLSPQNKDNKGKAYHIASSTYLFNKFDKYGNAVKNSDRIDAIATAVMAVNQMDSKDKLVLAEELLGANNVAAMKGLEITAELKRIAMESPEKIVGGTKGDITGFSDFESLIEAALEQGVLKKKGTKMFWEHQDVDKEEPISGTGSNNKGSGVKQLSDLLKENPKVLAELRSKVDLG